MKLMYIVAGVTHFIDSRRFARCFTTTTIIIALSIFCSRKCFCTVTCFAPQYAPCCTCTNGKIGQSYYNVGLMIVFSCHFVSRSQAQLESWRLCLKENFCTRFLSSLSVVEDMVPLQKHTHTKLLSQLASFHGNVTNSKSQSSCVSLPLNIGAQKILLALHLDVVKEGHY